MPITRKFLGLDRPALPVVAEYLMERCAAGREAQLDNLIVVVPGRRAGRRLLELLVARATRDGRFLSPPEVVTAGRLPERLYTPKRPFADDFVQQLAWAKALQGFSASSLAPLIPHPPVADDHRRWMELAEMLRRHHVELAGDGLNFKQVAERGGQVAGFNENRRWETLRQVQDAYLALLDSLDLWDKQTARLVAIERRECATDRDVILLATVDLNRAQRQMLDQIADRVTSLLFAGSEWADRFDRYGCLVPARWRSLPSPVSMQQVRLAEAPVDQAAEVVRCMAELQGRFRVDQLTVGIPEESLVPLVERQLQQSALRARWGPGRAVRESGPSLLLAAVARHLETDRFSDLAALLRHPDMVDYLERQGVHGDWITGLDKLHGERLPAQLPEDRRDIRWGEQRDASVEALVLALERLDQLLSAFRAAPARLGVWAEPLRELLLALYGQRDWNPRQPGDKCVLDACRTMHDVCGRFEHIPPSLMPEVSGWEALDLTLARLDQATAAPPDPDAVELVGWLELTLDDAPAAIVTNLNEGIVPKAVNSDLFLPNALRATLELDDNDRRYARDHYALSVLAAVRESLHLIVGRRSVSNDPLIPSRLLLAGDGKETARRVQLLFRSPPSTGAPLPGQAVSIREQSDFPLVRPVPLDKPITSLRVTGFRTYLACPYRFYLARVLRLRASDDVAEELDGALFGTVLHDVLQRFGDGDLRDCQDSEQLCKQLDHQLHQVVNQRFGNWARTAVLVQLEQLRLRLHAFARAQAEWAAAGWQIVHTEVPLDGGPPALLDVDGLPFELRGRIDRIDIHQTTGEIALLDYKSSDRAKTPEQAHQRRDRWVDLQLPLYRHLLAGLQLKGDVRMGYINLPKAIDDTGFRLAEWSEDALRDADHVAHDIIRNIRSERFWPPAETPPDFSEEFSPLCQDEVVRPFTVNPPLSTVGPGSRIG